MTLPIALQRLTRDAWLLFATRFIRLFAYGSLSVVLVFYLVGVGLSAPQTGMLLTLTLAGDTVVSLYLTTRADRFGRRRMLMLGAVLMATALGALAGGAATRVWPESVMSPVSSYRIIVFLYAAFGVLLAILFSRLSRAAEATTLGEKKTFRATFAGFPGVDRSRDVVVKLSALFALDAFGGGFVVQSFAAYWCR